MILFTQHLEQEISDKPIFVPSQSLQFRNRSISLRVFGDTVSHTRSERFPNLSLFQARSSDMFVTKRNEMLRVASVDAVLGALESLLHPSRSSSCARWRLSVAQPCDSSLDGENVLHQPSLVMLQLLNAKTRADVSVGREATRERHRHRREIRHDVQQREVELLYSPVGDTTHTLHLFRGLRRRRRRRRTTPFAAHCSG